MAIDDLNIYTRLCEILNIYIWGSISIWGEMGRGKGKDNCVEGREKGEREGGINKKAI